MPSTYKTPGVYVEEISTLPASIAQVETAIPAFIGFTEKASKQGKEVYNVPTRIKSLLEYEEYFGKGEESPTVDVTLNSENGIEGVEINYDFALYNSMKMFFSNGGGPCYIVSAGDYNTASGDYFSNLSTALTSLRKKDEPTLILFPDAAILSTSSKIKLGELQQQALKQCNDLQDRFCIFDLYNGDKELNESDADGATPDLAFRNKLGSQYLKYGAAYYPFIRTSLKFDFTYENLGTVTKSGSATNLAAISTSNTAIVNYENVLTDDTAVFTLINGVWDGVEEEYIIDYSSVALLNVDRLKESTRYLGFELIPEEYDVSTQVKAENQIKARIHFIADMITNFIGLTVTDNNDEDGDPSTKFYLEETHKEYIDKDSSRLYEVIKLLYFYDQTYSIEGVQANTIAADPKEVTPLVSFPGTGTFNKADASTITYDLSGVTISDATIATGSIYGAGDASTAKKKAVAAAAASLSALGELFAEMVSIYQAFEAEIKLRKENLEILLRESNPIYGNIVKAVVAEGIILPPSGAIAGVYAAVDNERGVWVAPANRSLSSVIGPVVNITAEDQSGLNVDATSGKSINAIRSFTGRGTLIWGARTTAGNSNEWRYVPVRRLFNMIEESVKKATEFVVFEPNDKNTWVRTKAMIDNFLNSIWKAGGLAGAKPEHAYIVKVGLGETMTAQDILEGRMIVEIHLAAVRPAEFIILRFMHKLQES